VALTPVSPATKLESVMDASDKGALTMAGNTTDDTVSMPTLPPSYVEMVTPVVAIDGLALFFSPTNVHTIAPELDPALVTVNTRVLPFDIVAVPAERPVQAAELGAGEVAKSTPDTVTNLMFVAAVAMVNDTVAVTLVVSFTLLDSATEAAVSAALKMVGKTTAETLSIPALLAA